MGTRDENVIDYIFRAKDAKNVQDAAKMITESFDKLPGRASLGERPTLEVRFVTDWNSITCNHSENPLRRERKIREIDMAGKPVVSVVAGNLKKLAWQENPTAQAGTENPRN